MQISLKASYPTGSRGTRIDILSVPDSTSTQWQFTGDAEFTLTTDADSGTSRSILDSGINFVDMWLPPFHTYLVRTRQYANEEWTAWSTFVSVASRGPVNSYENCSILNANTQTIIV